MIEYWVLAWIVALKDVTIYAWQDLAQLASIESECLSLFIVLLIEAIANISNSMRQFVILAWSEYSFYSLATFHSCNK